MDLFPGGYGLVFSLLFCFSTSSSLISGNFEVRPQLAFNIWRSKGSGPQRLHPLESWSVHYGMLIMAYDNPYITASSWWFQSISTSQESTRSSSPK